MTIRQNRNRLCALLLSGAMLLSQLPITARAENAPPEDGQIASFEALPAEVTEQTVQLGTALAQLELPETVTAAVYHVREDVVLPAAPDEPQEEPTATERPASEAPDQEAPVQDSGEPVITVATATETIPVSGWDSDPAYDGDAAGRYVFTPRIEGHTLAAGVEPPAITVTVEETSAALLGTNGAQVLSDEIVNFGHPLLLEGTFNRSTGLLTVMWQSVYTKWKESTYGISATDIKTVVSEADQYNKTIPADSFQGCTNLRTVTLPDSLTQIGSAAFMDCTSLTTINLPDNLKILPSFIFYNCGNLQLSKLPADLTSIEQNAFRNCTRITVSEIPAGVTQIADAAFQGCTGITEMTLHASIGNIKADAFRDCSNLRTLTIDRQTAPFLGANALDGTSDALEIWVPAGAKGYDADGWAPYKDKVRYHETQGDGYSFNQESGLLAITTNEGTAKWRSTGSGISTAKVITISLDGDVTEISANAFENCSNLEYAYLSDCTNLTKIPDKLFFQCTHLEDVRLPHSITSIGREAFSACIHLETLTLPEGVASIGAQAFYECQDLTALFLPCDPAPTLGNDAFLYTEKAVIYVPKGASGYTAENGWPTAQVVFGAALSNLTAKAGELTPAFFPGITDYSLVLPYSAASVVLYPTNAYRGSTITVDGKPVNSGSNSEPIPLEPGETREVKVVVTNSADDSATYTISVTRKLAPVDISAISGVTVPAYGEPPVQTITETDQYTGSVSWSPAIPPDGKFAIDTAYTATITLTPKSGYALEDVTENFFTVAGAASVSNAAGSGTVTAVFPKTNPGYTFHDGTLAITHDVGTTKWRKDTSIGWDLPNRCDAIRSVVVEDGVTEIGAEAFLGCGNLRSVELPASITSMKSEAFSYCGSLTALLLPRGAAPTLGENVFSNTARAIIYVPQGAGGYTAANGWPEDRVMYGAALSGLTVSKGTLTPNFSPGTKSYSLDLPEGETAVTVTPSTVYPGAGITVEGESVVSGGASEEIPLEPGVPKAIRVAVKISETDSVTYTITATVADTTAPALTAGSVDRVDDSIARLTFQSSEAGTYYYTVAAPGAGEPAIDTSGTGSVCAAGTNTITLDQLAAGAKEIYIKAKDAAGNVSAALQMEIPAYAPPPSVLTAESVERLSDTEATVAFDSSWNGQYYYQVVEPGAGEPAIDTSGTGGKCHGGTNTLSLSSLPAGALDIYIKVKDLNGLVSAVLKMEIPAYSDAFTVTGDGVREGTDYTYENRVLTILSATPMTIANVDPDTPTRHRIVVASPQGAAVTLNGVNIDMYGVNACALSVEPGSAASITLTGDNVLKGGHSSAGLGVPQTAKVTIGGAGSLTATASDYGAGIGGGGTIIINGGTVTANGGDNGGAGIGGNSGGGNGGGGGTIIINGGTVTANGGGAGIGGAGIGGGSGSRENGGDGGTITITGGTVTANGSFCGAGIGGGGGGIITITGGTVTANGGSFHGVGIGGGNGFMSVSSGGDGGIITITGGTVTAKEGSGGLSVGPGSNGYGDFAGFDTYIRTVALHADSVGGEGTADNSLLLGADGNFNVTGRVQLPCDLNITGGKTFTIASGATLTVPQDRTLTNGHTLNNQGVIDGVGTLTGDGTFTGDGEYRLKVSRTLSALSAASVGADSVTLNAVTASSGDGAVQYAVSATDSAPTEPDKWQGTLVFDRLTPGTDYYFFARVTGSRIYQDVVTSGVKIKTTETARYSLSASPSSLDFGSAAEGYSAPAARTVNIRNTGNRSVTLTKPTSASYTVGDFLPNETVAAGDTATFTVQPKIGLTAGNYDETLAVSDSGGASATVALKFTVKSRNTGGGGGSHGSHITVEPSKPTEQDPNPPTVGVITPPATVDKDGNVKVDVSDKDIQNAIDKAIEQAKKDGTEANGIAVCIDLSGLQTVFYHLPLTLSKNAYGLLVDAAVKNISIITPQISLSLDLATLKTIYAAANGDVTIDAVQIDRSKLPSAAQTALGSRPAYDLNIICKGKTISQFGGYVAITLPYPLDDREQDNALRMVWLDAEGQVRYITDSSYNADQQAVLGRTDHFTVFGIAEQPAPTFTDIDGHWAKDDILFVAERGLLNGTGDQTFSPSGSMTRGMFVTSLFRLAGNPQGDGEGGAFTDVSADAYYADAVQWAAAKGIVSGTSATTFAPEQTINRQQMAVILQNYAGALGYELPVTREAVTFTDESAIASWARDAVRALQQAGILMGRDANRFDPAGVATRGEVSALLHRYVALVIDPAPAGR